MLGFQTRTSWQPLKPIKCRGNSRNQTACLKKHTISWDSRPRLTFQRVIRSIFSTYLTKSIQYWISVCVTFASLLTAVITEHFWWTFDSKHFLLQFEKAAMLSFPDHLRPHIPNKTMNLIGWPRTIQWLVNLIHPMISLIRKKHRTGEQDFEFLERSGRKFQLWKIILPSGEQKLLLR